MWESTPTFGRDALIDAHFPAKYAADADFTERPALLGCFHKLSPV
jgi:hypothetical protein